MSELIKINLIHKYQNFFMFVEEFENLEPFKEKVAKILKINTKQNYVKLFI